MVASLRRPSRGTRAAVFALELMRRRARCEREGFPLGHVVRACRDGSVDVLLVKGIRPAKLLYPNPALRPFQDVDLHVHEDLRRGDRTAAQAGWRLLSRIVEDVVQLRQKNDRPGGRIEPRAASTP